MGEERRDGRGWGVLIIIGLAPSSFTAGSKVFRHELISMTMGLESVNRLEARTAIESNRPVILLIERADAVKRDSALA